MKKQAYIIIAITSFLFVLFLSHSLLEILDFDWSLFLHDVEKTEKFVLFVVGFQYVHDLSLSPVLARCGRAFSKKNAGQSQAFVVRSRSGSGC